MGVGHLVLAGCAGVRCWGLDQMGYNDCVTGRRGVHQDDDVNVNEDKVKVNNNDVKVNDSDADVSDGKDSTCVCLTRV